MQIAIDCAGFSPTEADRLRQAMSSKRAPERIEELRDRLLTGMTERGIPLEVAEDIYVKILAFSSYGFPESHAISFAYLVYASSWLKCYYPAAFTAALLRAQPMGFYSPASLIGDARRHGVRGPRRRHQRQRGARDAGTGRASRPGLCPRAGRVSPPGENPFPASRSSGSGCPRCAISAPGRGRGDRRRAAVRGSGGLRPAHHHVRPPRSRRWRLAGAFGCFGVSRREALWAAGAAATIRPGQLPGTTLGMTAPPLPVMTAAEETFADLWATGTYGTHPIEHIRELLEADAESSAAPA